MRIVSKGDEGMRELKRYTLKSTLPENPKLSKPAQAILEILKTGGKTSKELATALPNYKPGTLWAGLAELRKAGMLE
jgi:hypothetical protein